MEEKKYNSPISIIDTSVDNIAKYEFSEVAHNAGFVQYGEDDDLFDLLFDLYESSPTNQSILTSISTLIYGRGLNATNADEFPDQFARVNAIFDPEEVEKVAWDFGIANNGAFTITRFAGSMKAEHVPVQYLRASYATAVNGKPLYYYYCTDWDKVKNLDDENVIQYDNFEVNPQSNLSILYIRKYTPGSFFYSKVDYHSALPYCECEAELGDFHISNIDDGFSGKVIIKLKNGIPEEQQRQDTENKIDGKFSGSNGKKIVVLFADDDESCPEVDILSVDDIAEQFLTTSEIAEAKIIMGHRVTSRILVGLRGEGGFGNNAEELETAFALFMNMAILPKQETLLKGINKVLRNAGVNLDLYFTTLKPFEFMDIGMDEVSEEETERQTGVQADDQEGNFKAAFMKFYKTFKSIFSND